VVENGRKDLAKALNPLKITTTMKMGEEKKSVLGPDGLNEFGQYLSGLHGFENYSFEIEDPRGRMVDKSLDEVLTAYKAFLGTNQQRFRIRITCLDYVAGMMHQTDKVISRRSC
jgi:hypothetical protein